MSTITSTVIVITVAITSTYYCQYSYHYEYYCYQSMRAIKHKHHVIAMFAVGEGCPDPCVCK